MNWKEFRRVRSRKYPGICRDELRKITQTSIKIGGVPDRIRNVHVWNTSKAVPLSKATLFLPEFAFVMMLISGGMLIGWGGAGGRLEPPPHHPCCLFCSLSECKKYRSDCDVPSIFMTFNKFTNRHCSAVELLPTSRH
jgi:hypothetical protein